MCKNIGNLRRISYNLSVLRSFRSSHMWLGKNARSEDISRLGFFEQEILKKSRWIFSVSNNILGIHCSVTSKCSSFGQVV